MTRVFLRHVRQQAKRTAAAAPGKHTACFSTRGNGLLRQQQEQRSKVLTLDSMNPAVLNVEYAVRGAIPQEADRLEQRFRADPHKTAQELGFEQIIYANIGNPQQLGQKGLTFLRQVAALTECPDLLDNPLSPQLFATDAIERARSLLKEVGSTGAYTHSKGVPAIRKHVAEFIEQRDGVPADPEHIYLTSGASAGVSAVMSVLVENSNTGVLIPIPQYPLYTATIAFQDAKAVPYYLNEAQDWATELDQIKESLKVARDNGVDVRAIVVINPGNPTGTCLAESHIADVIRLAYQEKLVVLADEVYQTNIFEPEDRGFHSFKKVLRSMPQEISEHVELVSFHSTSKGQIGECGRRGGYFELVNIQPEVESQMFKMACTQLCAAVQGQIGVDIMVKPPQKGDASYEQHKSEIEGIHNSLKTRAHKLHQAFESLEGVTCSQSQGSMYLFPQIKLPEKAKQKASEAGMAADAFYCMELLKHTGICLVPGSGFGQEDGTLHFRTTFLAPQIDAYSDLITNFHKKFMDTYR